MQGGKNFYQDIFRENFKNIKYNIKIFYHECSIR